MERKVSKTFKSRMKAYGVDQKYFILAIKETFSNLRMYSIFNAIVRKHTDNVKTKFFFLC